MSARNYLHLAEEYLAAARNNLEAGLANPAASAAVHAVICANDALCLALIGERSRAKAHGQAARLLARACRGTPWEAEAARRQRQLTDVLAVKTEAEYSGSRLSQSEASRAVERAARFVAWAREVVVGSGA